MCGFPGKAAGNGFLLGFDELLATAKELLAAVTAQKMITQKERAIVMTQDLARQVWQGWSDRIQKDGLILRSVPCCRTCLYW